MYWVVGSAQMGVIRTSGLPVPGHLCSSPTGHLALLALVFRKSSEIEGEPVAFLCGGMVSSPSSSTWSPGGLTQWSFSVPGPQCIPGRAH